MKLIDGTHEIPVVNTLRIYIYMRISVTPHVGYVAVVCATQP